MESGGGWKFMGVTGKGQAGYADGGYVDDRASAEDAPTESSSAR